MQVFNATTQKAETPNWEVDANGELVATFKDGSFLKFPSGTSEADLKKQLNEHEKQNKGQEVITPEMEAKNQADREVAEKLADKLNGSK